MSSVVLSNETELTAIAAQPSGVSAAPSSFVSSLNWLAVQSILDILMFKVLMKMLNSIGPSTDPWTRPLVTGLQMVPRITMAVLGLFSQFSVNITAFYLTCILSAC